MDELEEEMDGFIRACKEGQESEARATFKANLLRKRSDRQVKGEARAGVRKTDKPEKPKKPEKPGKTS